MFLKLAFFVASLSIAAPSLDLNARYLNDTTYLNTIEATALAEYPVYESLALSGGARTSFSRADFEGLEYKAEAQTRLLGFLKPGVRLHQHYLFADTLSVSHLLVTLRLEARPFSWLTLSLTPGWYRRFTHLNKVVFLPVFRSSYTEHDFAGALGVEAEFEDWRTRLTVATFEELSVFNLNNPFAEAKVSHRFYGMQWSAFFRYQILLGFGRMDKLIMGFGLFYGF